MNEGIFDFRFAICGLKGARAYSTWSCDFESKMPVILECCHSIANRQSKIANS